MRTKLKQNPPNMNPYRIPAILAMFCIVVIQKTTALTAPHARLGHTWSSSPDIRGELSSNRATCLFSKAKQEEGRKEDDLKDIPLRKNIRRKTNQNGQQEDNLNRRQLLVSLLATASATGMAANAAVESSSITASAAYAAAAMVTATILKPPLDTRNYLSCVLDNGLRVVLCSDPTSSTAAAAMDVHVGAMSDPSEVPGLAHFTEHMLFLGTEKYPKEDSFSSFLSENGGSSNAYTDSENTVYYFGMVAESDQKWKEGLDRFGSFFSGPLFTEGATDRELNAIESENAKNLQSDVFRTFQIDKSRANTNHPYSKFFTGNKATLLEGTKAQNINLRQQLIEFYTKYYSSDQMTLAVVAPQSTGTLKSYVNAAFSSIPNRNVGRPEEAWAGYIPPFAQPSIIPSLGHVVEIVPVSDLRQVTLTFPIVFSSKFEPDEMLLFKPDYYVCHLIGHEGTGSLLSFLKKKGWANSLACATNEELSDFETFQVTVELTNKGLSAVNQVCEAIFSYIDKLKTETIPDYIFDEVLNLSELQWRFLTKGEQPSYATSLATNLQKYDPSLVIAGPRRLALKESQNRLLTSSEPRRTFTSQWQRDATKRSSLDLIRNLSVDNVMVTVISKTFEGQTDNAEKWYGTEYRYYAIPSDIKEKWMNPKEGLNDLSFPKRNPFIPSEEGLRVKQKPVNKVDGKLSLQQKLEPIAPPKLIRDDGKEGRWTVWFKQDDRFGEPKSFVIFELLTTRVFRSALDAIYANFYELSASDRLDEYTYDARLAGLSYQLSILPRGIRLTFGGYNDKLEEFSSYVAKKLAQDIDDVLPQNEEEFDRYKDRLTRALKSFDVQQPYSHSIYYSALLQTPPRFQYTNSELRDAISEATLSDLKQYVRNLWSSGKGEALLQGNLDRQEALAFVDKIDQTLNFKTIPVSDYPPRLRALPLPVVKNQVFPTTLSISEPNRSNKNSVSQVNLQCLSKSDKDHVLIEVLSAIIEEPFYDELRTRQQLGYIVSSGVKAVEQTRTLSLIVQSSVASAEKLSYEILKFMTRVRSDILEPLTEEEFDAFVKGKLDRKLEPDQRLAVEVTRNWNEIVSGRFQFNRIQDQAKALLALKKSDLMKFWDDFFSPESPERRIVVSQVIPKSGEASSIEPQKSYAYVVEGDGVCMDVYESGRKLGTEDIGLFRKSKENCLKDDVNTG